MSRKSRAQRAQERPCRTYWGSHGCKKQAGHSGVHFCSRGCGTPPPANALPNEHGMLTWDTGRGGWLTSEPLQPPTDSPQTNQEGEA